MNNNINELKLLKGENDKDDFYIFNFNDEEKEKK